MIRVLPTIAATVVLLGALSTPTPALADPYRFVKGPYIQSLGARSVVVRWEGNAAAGGTVTVVGTSAVARVREVKADSEEAFHSVEVGGLGDEAGYRYFVTAGGVKSEEGRFTTPKDEDKKYTFQVYGDNRNDHVAHAAIVSAMHARPASFAVHTGDMVAAGNNEADWATFFLVEAPLLRDRCIFACVGNHELVGGGEASFMRYFHPDRKDERTLTYSARWGNARFFLLNAFSTLKQGKDRDWLERALTDADTEAGIVHRFLVLHQGPASCGPHGAGAHFDESLQNLLRAHKITMIFAGHDHLYERGERDGLRYIVTGGAGAPLYPIKPQKSPPTQAAESSHHFVEVRVDGAKIVTSAYRKDLSLMDRCTIEGASFTCEATTIAIHRDPITGAVAPETPKNPSCACSWPGNGRQDSAGAAALVALGGFLSRLRLASRRRCLLSSSDASSARPGLARRRRLLLGLRDLHPGPRPRHQTLRRQRA